MRTPAPQRGAFGNVCRGRKGEEARVGVVMVGGAVEIVEDRTLNEDGVVVCVSMEMGRTARAV